MTESRWIAGRAVLACVAILASAAMASEAGAQESYEAQIERGAVDVPRGDLFVRDVDRVWTATGDVLENVSISIRDGVIERVGSDLEPSGDDRIVDGSGLTAIPGIVDAHSHIAMEGTNEGTATVVPEVRVLDALDHEEFSIYRALSGGVTTAHVMHGSSNPIGGQNAIIKTRWKMESGDQLLLQGAPRTVKFALGENVTQKNWSSPGPDRFPSSRIGVEQVYVEAFEAARAYRDEWNAYRTGAGDRRLPPRRDLRLEALVDIMEGRISVHAHSYRADEILMLMGIAERFGFRIDVFQHVLEGYKVAAEMAAHGAGGSTFSDWWMYKLEAADAIPYNAAIMQRYGVLTSINSDIPWLQSFMVQEMSKPVRYGGVSREEALRMLTLYPARQLHIEDRVGSLEPGKDGDVVLLSSDPFDTGARVEKTIVDGILYWDRERDEELREEPVRELASFDPSGLSDEPVALADWPDASARVDGAASAAAGSRGTAGTRNGTGGPAAGDAGVIGTPSRTAPTIALVGGTVHPVSSEPIEDGAVLIRDGRIAAVGTRGEVEIPADATVRELDGRHVYPGLIDPNTSLGLVELDAVTQSRDDRTVGRYNPHLRASAAVNVRSAAIPVARAGGITAALTAPSSGIITGSGSVLQLRGDTPDRMAILDGAALMVDFPSPSGDAWEDPALEGDRLEELVDLFERARLYEARPSVADNPTAPFGPNLRPGAKVLLDAMLPAIRGEMPVFFEVDSERDIRTLLLFLDEFPELAAVVVGGDQAYRVADELAERGIPVIVGSGRSPTMDRDDPIAAGWENAARLHAAGVKVAFSTGSVADVRTLPEHAARATAYGLPREIALRGMTLSTAEILGLGEVTGSIEEGKRADLIVTDGDPLQIVTQVERSYVGGVEMPIESKHTRLWREFRNR